MRNLTAAVVLLAAPVVARAQEPVSLQCKFALGQETTYRLTATGLASIETDAPPGDGIPAGDIQFDINADFAERVDALGEGWGELAVRLKQASLSANLASGMGQIEFHLKLPEAQIEVLVNGQLMPQEQKPQDMRPILALMEMPILVRVDATGRVVRLPQLDLLRLMSPLLNLDAMQAGSTGYLPPQPVRAGDRWQQKQMLPVALPAPDGTQQSEIVIDHVLRELTKLGARDVAVIGTQWQLALGDMRNFRFPGQPEQPPKEGEEGREPAGLEGADFAVAGDLYFDWNAGRMVRADLNVKGNLSFTEWKVIPEQPGAPPPPAEPEQQPEPILTHTSLRGIDISLTIEQAM